MPRVGWQDRQPRAIVALSQSITRPETTCRTAWFALPLPASVPTTGVWPKQRIGAMAAGTTQLRDCLELQIGVRAYESAGWSRDDLPAGARR
jgi:hypothetical protein